MQGMPCLRTNHKKPSRVAIILNAVLLCGLALAGQSDADETQKSTSSGLPDGAAAAANDDGDRSSEGLTDAQLQLAIARLISPRFEERQQATIVLKSVRAGQIPLLVVAVAEHAEAEVTRVVFELLTDLYIGEDPALATAAGEVLETSISSDRWIIAESAGEILDRHWKRRSDLAMTELRRMGASFNATEISGILQPQIRPNNFLPGQGLIGNGYDNLQISLNKEWVGGERGISLLLRLADVTVRKALFGGPSATVYLIDGHPLQEPEVIRLKAVFGDRNVVIRGRVCLGIVTRQPQEDEGGCRVSDVKENSSAHSANIQPGDLITHLNGDPIRDFDMLVALLRKYDVGEKVTMSIRRGGLLRNGMDVPPGLFDNPQFRIPDDLREPKKLTIEVELKGWN